MPNHNHNCKIKIKIIKFFLYIQQIGKDWTFDNTPCWQQIGKTDIFIALLIQYKWYIVLEGGLAI